MTTIGDIFDISTGVHQGVFVLRLTEGLRGDRHSQTLRQYVVVPGAEQLAFADVPRNIVSELYQHSGDKTDRIKPRPSPTTGSPS